VALAEPIVLMTWPLERKFRKCLLFLSSAANGPQPLSILGHFESFLEIVRSTGSRPALKST